jgi:hypothetical protein
MLQVLGYIGGGLLAIPVVFMAIVTGVRAAAREAIDAGKLRSRDIDREDAGAALVYALYHLDATSWAALPDSVVEAYGNAYHTYGLEALKQ